MFKRWKVNFRVQFSFKPFCFFKEDCGDYAVGVFSDTKISDDKITSSTVGDSATTPARNGRLSYTRSSSWCASSSDQKPYLQIDLGDLYVICAVSTQGNSKVDMWVKSYQIGYSSDSEDWLIYREQNVEKVRADPSNSRWTIFIGRLTRLTLSRYHCQRASRLRATTRNLGEAAEL